MVSSKEIRKKYLNFFESKGHKVIPSASLIPENDPTVLFTTAGMQPLVPYLMGENHPMGKRLTNSQKCVRTDDIEEVGDKVHHTFFEMLGNWSLGDYFKEEAIEWSFEFLTKKEFLGLDKNRLAFTVFAGDEIASVDDEAYKKWLSLGIAPERIAKLPRKNNWWGPGETGPCGPDTEMFYWTGELPVPDKFDDKNENWVEIWNNVFMQYYSKNGEYTPLAQKNVDTGMGLERMTAVINGFDDNYKTDLFSPIIDKLSELSGKKYEDNQKQFRIIADHIKAATFAISDGASPSNKDAGYVVRRLIRRAVVKALDLSIKRNFTRELGSCVFEIYDGVYNFDKEKTLSELEKEEDKFRRTLLDGLKVLNTLATISGKDLFDLYQSFGIPLEISLEEAKKSEIKVQSDAIDLYKELYEEHRALSRTASAGMFRGGLADGGEIVVKYHTVTHLLHQALRQVLGDHVWQRGSNITAERLRFDFQHGEKMTPDQIKKTEDIVNEQIKRNLPVILEEMSPAEAEKAGALGFFGHKYGDIVKVYTIGNSTDDFFSKEICGGPHVNNTSELGHFKIKKEESSSSGVRRIKAVLE